MTTKEELEEAIVAYRLIRKIKEEELPNRINGFLDNNLAKAIAEGKTAVSVAFNREEVSEELWEELHSYGVKNYKGDYRRNLVDIIVEDVYKPYLASYTMSIGHLMDTSAPIRVTFFLNQY